MKLATLRRLDGTTVAARVEGDFAVEIEAADVGALLTHTDWRFRAEEADGHRHQLSAADFAPVIPKPEKVLCIGLNYRTHIAEMGRDLPSYPTVFTKFARALVGAHDEVVLPDESDQVDWEAELAVIIGTNVRRATRRQAQSAIAGYAVLNDVTMRDWQNHTSQWVPGKSWEASSPFGPYLVTADDPDAPGAGTTLSCQVDGDRVQEASVMDLVFDPVALICYLSTFVTLVPGDVIATGTPAGVGHACEPPRYLQPGQTLVTHITGMGECRNRFVRSIDANAASSLGTPGGVLLAD